MTGAGVLPRCRAPFASDDEIEVLTAGFLDGTLPAKAWTHDAHWAVSVCLHMRHAGFDLRRDLPGAIRRYNIASGGENTDTAGYHETITRASIAMVETAVRTADPGTPAVQIVNGILASDLGKASWIFEYWTKDLLMTPAARKAFVAPDLRPVPGLPLAT